MLIKYSPGDVASINLNWMGYGMIMGIQIFVQWLSAICTELVITVSKAEASDRHCGILCRRNVASEPTFVIMMCWPGPY